MREPDRPALLVLRALGLGDFLTSLPCLRALAAAFPRHRRILAAPSALAPLVRLSNCGYAVAHCPDLETPPKVEPRLDLAVNLHGRGPQSHRLLLRMDPTKLIAFRNEELPGTAGFPPWPDRTHEVDRWCGLLQHFDITCDSTGLDLRPPPELICKQPELTIIHPGAASPARRWPPGRWGKVAESEVRAGREVVLTGTRAEREICAFVARRAGLPSTRIIAGETNLVELAALVCGAGRLICGDTGIAHLATAVGTPSVVLFGPTSPLEWGPPRDNPIHRVLWKGFTGDPHAARPDAGLLDITVEEVLHALRHLPSERLGADDRLQAATPGPSRFSRG